MMYGGMLKVALVGLNDKMKEIGREVNAEKIAEIVETHAIMTAAGAAASGVIPGAGGAISMGLACASTVTMYGRLAAALGVRLNHGLIKAIASAVIADLAAMVTATIVATAAISFVPGVGSMASSTLTAITNCGFVYLAGIIFIKVVTAFGVNRIESMTETELVTAVKEVQTDMDMKKAMKEAKQVFKSRSLG